MATPEFLNIAAYANALEAEHACNVLKENDVPAFVDGAAANTLLSHIGSALGGVRVFVRADDAEQARQILDDNRAGFDPSAPEWFCGSCEETVDGAFEVCWSCGEARAEVEQPFPVESEDDHFDRDLAEEEADLPAPDYPGYDVTNPYASPIISEAMETPPDEEAEIDEEAEAMLLRAWRASIIGIVFFPVLLHIYSMYLLLRASLTATAFSTAGNRRFYLAFLVNVIAGCLWGTAIRLMLGALS